jgi:hypothetical protein
MPEKPDRVRNVERSVLVEVAGVLDAALALVGNLIVVLVLGDGAGNVAFVGDTV